MIIAVDGGKTCGWSVWKNDGRFVFKNEGPIHELYDMLEMIIEGPDSHTLIAEDYTLDPTISQGGSKLEACQVIGAVEFAARMCGAKFVKQQASILFSAQKMSGVEVPKHGRKGHDENSAYNHGIFWMVKNGIIENPAHSRIVRTAK